MTDSDVDRTIRVGDFIDGRERQKRQKFGNDLLGLAKDV